MPRVSVVIPAYNAAALLGETLQSTLESTYEDFEVVVVNDGSQDETALVAASFGSRVRVISQKNAGMSASRNRAIADGDSEFVALLDSDDLWHPEKMRWQVAAFDANPDHSYCFTGFTVWNGERLPEFMSEPRTGAIEAEFSGWIYHKLILTNWSLPSSVMFRRQSWDSMTPFLCEDQQTDDWEYFVRSSQNFRFLKLAEPYVLYRQHPGSLSRKISEENKGELMRESLIRRYGMKSPDGVEIDGVELESWRYLGWRNFADAHCARGSLSTGLEAFGRLLLTGPRRADSLGSLTKSLVRRVFPKR